MGAGPRAASAPGSAPRARPCVPPRSQRAAREQAVVVTGRGALHVVAPQRLGYHHLATLPAPASERRKASSSKRPSPPRHASSASRTRSSPCPPPPSAAAPASARLMATTLVLQLRPEAPVGLAQLREQLRGHLPHRLRLARELAEVVPVAHSPAAEALPGMAHPLRPEASVTSSRPTQAVTESPAQRSGTAYQAPSTRTSALRLTETGCSRRASNASPGRGRSTGSSVAKRSHTCCGARRSTPPLHLLRELLHRVPAGDRREDLQPHAFAPGLHAALVVPLAGTREAGLDAVVADERREAVGQDAARELHPPHRGGEVVVDRVRRGTPPKWAKARTRPSRKASWSWRS